MFNCTCSDYDTYNEFHVVATRTARKTHRCCECGADIKPGDTYEYARGKSEGDFWTAKTCLLCCRIRADFMQCGFCYGDLWESIHEANCRNGEYAEDDFCICPR